MNKKEFENEIIARVKEEMGDGYSVELRPVNKNNGIVLSGLVINDGLTNISPTIYLDYYLPELEQGKSIEQITEQIIAQYRKFSVTDDFDITVFTDYEKCKEHIAYKIINYEKNKEMLKDVPYIIYLDMAIVFYCLLSSDQMESSSILIRNSHLQLWGVTVDDLYEVASQNTPKLLPAEIKNLSEIVKEMLAKKTDSMSYDEAVDILEMPTDVQAPMYVLTNTVKLYGACCVLYKHLLSDFSEKVDNDLWIIPSSTHETLLIPATEEYDEEYLSELVKEVNSSQLEVEDVLSDHVYFYSRKEDAVTYRQPEDVAC